MAEQDFIKAGFTVVGAETNENKLLSFLKENYPSIIRDTEINLEELKTVLGLPIDEKVNGYGLNFVGRNFARAKYAQKTERELRLNTTMCQYIDNTQNLVLKGDNLDSLKILKNHYTGKIKCIYIDPPYNTANDEFVYPDKFDKEETEVLGLANISESDFERMDFSFKTKKSHNGWLAFMYSRLLLARDLLSKDGSIFISIDDNELVNLKLLCDNDIFGEENFLGNISVVNNFKGRSDDEFIATANEYLVVYAKNKSHFSMGGFPLSQEKLEEYDQEDEIGKFKEIGFRKTGKGWEKEARPKMHYPVYYNGETNDISLEKFDNCIEIFPLTKNNLEGRWRWGKDTFLKRFKNDIVIRKNNKGNHSIYTKMRLNDSDDEERTLLPKSIWIDTKYDTSKGGAEVKELFQKEVFDNPKGTLFIKDILTIATDPNDIILDFFAGSGTTGQAVMQLNAEDSGNRKFILCQEDREIGKEKQAYKFCTENNLPTVISSITIERLKRAGEKITKDIEAENSTAGLFEEDKKQVPDIGFKVFDSVEAPKLKVDDKGQILISEYETDAISRIYNMIFTIGLDEPSQVPEEVVKDSIYKIGNHYYITNSEKITSDDYSTAIKNGKVFIDGWTASLNGTLQNYKEDVKIVF